MGGHRVLVDAGGVPPPRRCARRPLRPQADLLDRRRLVRRRLGRLRPRAERRGCSSPPGWSRASAPHCWRRPAWPSCRLRSAPTTGPAPSAPGPDLGGVAGRRRAAGGRLSHRHRLVALGLLHQPPRCRRGARHHGPPRARDPGPDGQRSHRHRRRRPGGRVPRQPDLRADRSPHARVDQPGGAVLPRGGRRDCARLRPRRAPPGPSDAPAPAVPLPPVQRGQRRHLRRLWRPRWCPLPAPRRAPDRQGLQPARVRRRPAPPDAGHAHASRPGPARCRRGSAPASR